jgi:hypothetical protein
LGRVDPDGCGCIGEGNVTRRREKGDAEDYYGSARTSLTSKEGSR